MHHMFDCSLGSLASPTPAEDQNTNSRPTSPADGTAQNNGPESDTLTLRALVTTKEAGVIIGKGGKNVADLREQTGVKAGVSKVVQGVNERVLSVSGTVEDVAKVGSCILAFAVSAMRPPSLVLCSPPSSLHFA
jgi:heterogeneous nuclear rnp K-like protein 2